MIRATVSAHCDLLDVVGCPVSGEVILPFAEWPLHDGRAIELPECNVRRWTPPPPPKPTFKKAPPKGLHDVGSPPEVPEMGAPLAPEAFFEWVVARLPTSGAVDPLDKAHPAFGRVVTAARAGLSKAPRTLGVNADASAMRLAHDLEYTIRLCALPAEAAFVVLRPAHPRLADDELRARIAAAAASGLVAGPTVATNILATYDEEVAATAAMKARDAAALLRLTEKIDVDLAAAGLAAFEASEANPFGRIYLAGPLPIGASTSIEVPFLDKGEISTVAAVMRGEGTSKITRAERDAAPCLPDEIASALYRARRREAGTRRYQASDFTGDPRSAEGRLALLAYRTRCAGLVDALAAQRNRTALAAWVGESLMTLPVAFGGRVSLVNAIDSIQEALRSHVRLASRTRTYGANQKVSPEVTSEIWPTGLIAPDAVPRTVLAELAKGSPWKFGELLAPPTPEQEREIRLALDPQAFERVIVDAVGDGTEVRSAALYDRLHAENLTGGATPSPAERARVRVALEALGFARAEGVDPDGRRCRVWRRPPKVATPAPEAAQ